MFEKGKCVAYNGNVYMHHDSIEGGHYRRLELYLPSAEGTYGEPVEETFYKMVDRIEKGLLYPKCADGVKYEKSGDKMRPLPGKKK